jgi:hypothetical protein
VGYCPFQSKVKPLATHTSAPEWIYQFCGSDCALWTEHGCSIKLLATNNQHAHNLVKDLEKLLEAAEITIYFKESKPSAERLSQ